MLVNMKNLRNFCALAIVALALPCSHVSPASETTVAVGTALAGIGGGVLGYLIAQGLKAPEVSQHGLDGINEQAVIDTVSQGNEQTKNLIRTLSLTGLGAAVSALIVYCMLSMPEHGPAPRQGHFGVRQPIYVINPLDYYASELTRAERMRMVGNLPGAIAVLTNLLAK